MMTTNLPKHQPQPILLLTQMLIIIIIITITITIIKTNANNNNDDNPFGDDKKNKNSPVASNDTMNPFEEV